MDVTSLRRALAVGVVAVAVFNTLASLSLPRPEIHPAGWRVVLWLTLLVAHAGAYWFGTRLLRRFGDIGYIVLQGVLVVAIGLSGALFPVGFALYVALTIYAILVAAGRWSSVPITFAAIILFGVNAIVTSNLYKGATAGVFLAVAGVIGHAVAALVRRQPAAVVSEAAVPTTAVDWVGLTPREREVLEALAAGARNREIASQLGIAERTVKAHVASIYSKLGVESRVAAVAAVARQKAKSS
jgi:DNA-binding CsgD family transcriptional regulator